MEKKFTIAIKKFTIAMLCEEFGSNCIECPLHSIRNTYGKPCWLLDKDKIQVVMKDYPYADVKNRMKFNDIETRLTAVEERVEKKDTDGVEFTFKPGRIISGNFSTEVVDKKLYDKLEAKHEADCRLISEYDIENKKLKDTIRDLNTLSKKRFFDLKNAENERDHYKGLYSSKCDDYDRLLEKQLKTEKELKCAEEVGDRYKSLYDTTCDNYEKLYEENNKLIKENKTFNVLLINKTETIGKLGDEYDKLKEQNSILTKENKKLTESNNNHATDNVELEGENDALSTRNAFLENIVEELENKIEAQKNRITNLESKLRNQRANLASLQEKYEDAVKMNKAREDVYYANIKLQKTIEAKDREIGLLRAELDKYTPDDDDECDDRWID